MHSPEGVVPPGNHQRVCGLHWLRIHHYGSSDSGNNLIALQWNPGSKTWTHSNQHDVHNSRVFDTRGWEYVEPIPFPDIDT